MTDRVLVPLPDGRWLALAPDVFRDALTAGTPFSAAPVTSTAVESAEGEGGESLVTAKALAKTLSLPVSCLYEYAKAGRIPSVRVGKHVRFNAAQVLAALRATGAVTVGQR